jgi:hypothetical protein
MYPAMFMSRLARSKNSRLGQRLPGYHVARLRNHAMPQLLDHFGEHHADQGFIFNQEYGRCGHISPLPHCIGNYTPVPENLFPEKCTK